jgi:epoxyqueuosine reductase QueG
MQEYNLAKSQQEYENIMSQYNMLQQSGSAQAQQFHELAYANRMAALQGYADQMDQMLEEYGMHLEEIQTHADLTYQSIMTSMGYDQQLMQQIATEYMTELQPLLTQLGIDLDQIAIQFQEQALLQQASEQEEASFWNTISQILKIGGFILSLFGLGE